MTVLHPCDDLSAEELTVQLVNHSGPSYMRTARNKTPRIYNEVNVSNLAIGKGSVIREGTDVCILACGVMVSESLSAADELAESGISVSVVDMHTLKPLDCALVDRLASECGCIVTAEDHSVIGGLGGAVAEHLSVGQAVPLEMVGVRDRFGESGSPSELMSEFGLTSTDIQNAARRAMERK